MALSLIDLISESLLLPQIICRLLLLTPGHCKMLQLSLSTSTLRDWRLHSSFTVNLSTVTLERQWEHCLLLVMKLQVDSTFALYYDTFCATSVILSYLLVKLARCHQGISAEVPSYPVTELQVSSDSHREPSEAMICFLIFLT